MTRTRALPLPFRVVNRVGRLLLRAGLRRLRFDPAALMEDATARAGLSDFAADTTFSEALEVLCRSAVADARLSFIGVINVRKFIVRALVNRLRYVAARRQAGRPVRLRSPLIVTGLPRSGTTFLHHLLTLDPGARPIRFWELMEPLPGPGRDHRRRDLARLLANMKRIDANVDVKHELVVDNPEECMLLLDSTLVSPTFYVYAPLFEYRTWLQARDQRAPYQTYRWYLEHFQRLSPTQHLTLKAPTHLGALPALLEAVPEACIVRTHRDPVAVASSLNSLIASLHGMVSEPLDRPRMAEANLQLLEYLLRGGAAARAQRPDAIFDLEYEEIVEGPLQCVQRIYERFGLPFSDAYAERLHAFIRTHPKNRIGRHVYSAGDFGLTEEVIRERLAG
jgi:hypothetical protein